MTENEAIEFATEQLDIFGGRMNEYLKMTIKALEEIQQYRAIGTVGECRVAVEKQIPKKVNARKVKKTFCGALYAIKDDCPSCGAVGILSVTTGYCHCCGQRLDWEEE